MRRVLGCLFAVATLVFTPVGNASYVWSFTNSGLMYGPTDSVYLQAVFTNTGTNDLVISVDNGSFGQGIGHGSFPTAAYPEAGKYEFNFDGHNSLLNRTIAAGESVNFLFGMYAPVTSVTAGTYTTATANLAINGGTNVLEASGGQFVATVVPVPAAVWLLGSGLIAVAGIARRRRADS